MLVSGTSRPTASSSDSRFAPVLRRAETPHHTIGPGRPPAFGDLKHALTRVYCGMFARRWLLLLTVSCTAAFAGEIRVKPDAGLEFRYEPGVETRLLLFGGFEAASGSRAGVFGGFALGAIDNPGIARYGIGGSVTVLDAVKLRLQGQVNHDEWSSWRAGENRAAGMIAAEPLRGLELGIGLAWRVPVYDSLRYCSPFIWSSEAPEWNYVYQLDWTFLQRDSTRIALWLANLDRLTIHNPQQLPFGVHASFAPRPRWRLNARLGSDIKGLSSLLFSLGELDLRLGISRDF